MSQEEQEKVYLVNEVYYTIQGEGVRYGIPHVFVRFAQCNLTCGFCDTEYESYEEMTALEILARAEQLTRLQDVGERKVVKGGRNHGLGVAERVPCRNVLFCGGEPLLQLDAPLIDAFKTQSDTPWYIAVETNGTMAVPPGVDWTVCSPKVAEHAIVPKHVNVLKYVRDAGMGIPRPQCTADYYLISPMFQGLGVDPETIKWCFELTLKNPQWRLTVQHQKTTFGGIR